MVIVQDSKNELPEKAVRISRSEVLDIQYKTIYDWEPIKDVWPLRYGGGVLSAASILSSIYIMNHYRKKLKLRSFGRPVMFIPGVVIPAMVLPLAHNEFVLHPLLLHIGCPVCIQLRSAAVQTTVSVAYPLLVHSLSSFFLANSFATYRLPSFTLSSLGELTTLWKKFSRPLNGILPWHILFQVAVSFIITDLQAKSFFHVQGQLIQKMQLTSSQQ